MQNELSDSEIVRLIAYVKPIQLSNDDEYEDEEDLEVAQDMTAANEYLIDFLTVQEAKNIGSNGILNKIAEVLFTKNVIKKSDEQSQVVWRLVRHGDLTPIEQQTKQINDAMGFEQEKYQVTDLRHLH